MPKDTCCVAGLMLNSGGGNFKCSGGENPTQINYSTKITTYQNKFYLTIRIATSMSVFANLLKSLQNWIAKKLNELA